MPSLTSEKKNNSTTGVDFDYNSIEVGYYDRIFNQKKGIQSKWHHHKFLRFHRELKNFKNHLDIGCGPGTFIGSLPQQGHSLGVDIAAPQISFAKNKYQTTHHSFQLISPGPLPFEDNTFDAITMIELIEHIPEKEAIRLIAETHRVLKPGGRLLLSTPNYHSGWPILEWLVNKIGPISYEDQHITHFNRKWLRNVIQQAGFSEVNVSGYLLISPFVAALNWKISDIVERLEPKWMTNLFGNLLFGIGTKA